jgi:hypothetical protein
MSPCPWPQTTGLEGWLRSFLQGTWLGRNVVRAFWKILGDDAIALNKLHDHPETKKLVPWRGAFEVSNCLSIHNYPSSFFDLVRQGKIKVVIDEVQSFKEGRELLLKSGDKLEVDAVVCATGWEVANTLRFEPESLEKELGLPTVRQILKSPGSLHALSPRYLHPQPDVTSLETTRLTDIPLQTNPLGPEEEALIHRTESNLLEQYPVLQRDTSRTNHLDPALRHTQTPNTSQQPYRFHRFMVPPAFLHSHSIAFAGSLYCLGSFPLAYIQSLWISAYFDDKLSLPFEADEKVVEKVYRDTQYCVLRTAGGGYGRTAPDVVFDSLPYFDVLLRDLGLEARRKGEWWKEIVASYGPEDWRGLVAEWEMKQDQIDQKKTV